MFKTRRAKSMKKTAQEKSDSNTSQQKQSLPQGYLQQAEEKVSEWLESEPVYKKIEETLNPLIIKPMEKFVENNVDKIPEYAANPQVLEKDLEEYFDFLKWGKWANRALDVIFVTTTLISIATTISSGGATAGATIPLETAKWTLRSIFKKLVNAFTLKTLKKIFSKAAFKVIKEKGLSQVAKTIGKGAFNLTGAYLDSAIRLAIIHSSLEILLTTVETFGEGVVKQIIVDKGSDLGLPDSLMGQIKGSEIGSIKSLIKKSYDEITNQLKDLFTTKGGIASTLFLATLRQFKVGTLSRFWSLEKFNQLIHKTLGDPKYSKYINPKLLGYLQGLTGVNDQIDADQYLKQLHLPQKVKDKYKETFTELAKNKSEDKLKKTIENINNNVLTMHNTADDVVTLDFLKNNLKTLDNKEIDEIIQDVTHHQFDSQQELVQELKVPLEKGIDTLKKSKYDQFVELIRKLSPGEESPEMLRGLIEAFSNQLQLGDYKNSLEKKYIAAKLINKTLKFADKLDEKGYTRLADKMDKI